MKKSFGERLKESRGNRSRSEMANVFGISVTAYGNWERGDKEPDIATICSICKEYNISADWLLGLPSVPSVPSVPVPAPDESFWRGLVSDQQAVIASLTRQLADKQKPTTAPPALAGGRSATKTA